jgi:hypothetical protein
MTGILLYDGDAIRYSIGFACEFYLIKNAVGDELKRDTKIVAIRSWLSENNYLPVEGDVYVKGDDTLKVTKEAGRIDFCLHTVKTRIEKAMRLTNCDQVIVLLSGKNNFRDSVAKQKKYKGNRDNSVKPLLYEAIGEYLIRVWEAKVVDLVEADDALSFLALAYKEQGIRAVIATGDKDLSQVAVPVFNINTDTLVDVHSNPFGELQLVSRGSTYACKGYGKKFYYAQILMGDPVDNIGGCRRWGAKKTYDYLNTAETEEQLQELVLAAYKETYPEAEEFTDWQGNQQVWKAEDFLIEQATLLHMLQKKPDSSGEFMWRKWWQ